MESSIIYDHETTAPPLCVDLDGTLINTDLLMESLFALLRQSPGTALQIPYWLLQGKGHLKEQLVCRVTIDVTVLPYHVEFLAYLRQRHALGRRLVLATASHLRFAQQVALHLGIFESVLATENGQNLSRSRKGECLAVAYGERGFDYAGNSRADLAVWSRARAAILVNPVPGVTGKVRAQVPITAIFDDRAGAWKIYLKTLRLHRWLKNLIIFLPVLIEPLHIDSLALTHAWLAFLAFGLCDSSVYILSDLLNLATDRHLTQKRQHSLVAGTISIIHGAILVPSLLVLAVLVAIPLPWSYLAVLVGYYLLSLTYYSTQPISGTLMDILIRTGLYIIRLIAGSIVVGYLALFSI